MAEAQQSNEVAGGGDMRKPIFLSVVSILACSFFAEGSLHYLDFDFVPMTDYIAWAQTTDTTKDLWVCPNCGNEVYSNYCNNCGTERPVEESAARELQNVLLDLDIQACTAMYQSIISMYAQAEREGWDYQAYENNDLAPFYCAYRISAAYCFADINSDGNPELLVDRPEHDEGGNFNALYTLVENEPVLLIDRGEGQGMFLCIDGTVAFHDFTGDPDFHDEWEFYTLPKGGNNLLLRERMGAIDGFWYRNSVFPTDHSQDMASSQDEVMAAVGSYNEINLSFFRITEENPSQRFAGESIENSNKIPFYGIWCLGTKDENEAWSFANDLHSQGYPTNVYLTTDWSNLNAEPWYVVSAGEYNSEKEAYSSLGWVQKVCGDAYVKWTGEFVG